MNKLNPDITSNHYVLRDNADRLQSTDHSGKTEPEASQVQDMRANEKAPLRTSEFSNGRDPYTSPCHSPPHPMRHFNGQQSLANLLIIKLIVVNNLTMKGSRTLYLNGRNTLFLKRKSKSGTEQEWIDDRLKTNHKIISSQLKTIFRSIIKPIKPLKIPGKEVRK